VDAPARALGLRPGLPVAQAQASVPGLSVADATPDEDADALRDLAGWCLRYSPLVQPDPPDGLLIETEGAAHLFGGEAALLDTLTRRLASSGLAVRTALADTPGAAWALARFGDGRSAIVVPPGRNADALAGLPVGALRLADETRDALQVLGLGRIGAIAAIPRAQLTLRFGREVADRYDQALGRLPEPLTPLVPRGVAHAKLAFAEPLCDAAGLAAASAGLLPDLCRELASREEGLRRLDAVFRRVDGVPIAIRVGTAAPTRDPRHLAQLVAERLPQVDPGFGIDEIVVLASRTEAMRERQVRGAVLAPFEGGGGGRVGLGTLVDKLGNRLGEGRVFRAAPVESRVPERSVRRVPALAPPVRGGWPAGLPRPSRIIDPPEPVAATALLPDHPPTFFVWRRVRYVVRGADGPERVRGEWWRADAEMASLRDYYRVEDEEGRRFWLFRDAPAGEDPRWWLHGRFS
jgi:protein ImuB